MDLVLLNYLKFVLLTMILFSSLIIGFLISRATKEEFKQIKPYLEKFILILFLTCVIVLFINLAIINPLFLLFILLIAMFLFVYTKFFNSTIQESIFISSSIIFALAFYFKQQIFLISTLIFILGMFVGTLYINNTKKIIKYLAFPAILIISLLIMIIL